MADVSLPAPIVQWMRDRQWGSHHLQWHTTRRWDRLPATARAQATAVGWQRASRQEGEPGNGFEFLLMHRAMMQLLRESFPSDQALFDGWATPPTDPDAVTDPVPLVNPDRDFSPQMLVAINKLTNHLDTFANDDELGLYIETNLRPTPANPFKLAADHTTGIHNYLHNRFSDDSSPVNMGDPDVNLENRQFWRLHGWIEGRWTAFRALKNLSDQDPAFQQVLQQEKQHLAGHMHPVMAPMHAMSLAKPSTRSISTTLRRPFRETLSTRFHRLATTTPEITSVAQLHDYLQVAIQLEHATLPLYLTAMWSIRSDAGADAQSIREILLHIAYQEMFHLGLVCNLLKAVGGQPRINTPDAVLQFPDFLPGLELKEQVHLRPLTPDQVKVFLQIESPEKPIPPQVMTALALAMPNTAAVERHPTIGSFYAAIEAGLKYLNPSFNGAGQLEYQVGNDKVTKITSLDEALQAIHKIQEQGEGTSSTQGAADFGGGLAHYYQFEQIDKGMKYVQVPGTNTYKLDPTQPLKFPSMSEIYPMASVPKGGYPGVPAADDFDKNYSAMLAKLQQAWDQGSPGPIGAAVGAMYQMENLAITLMQTPIPNSVGNYGPAFLLVPVPGP